MKKYTVGQKVKFMCYPYGEVCGEIVLITLIKYVNLYEYLVAIDNTDPIPTKRPHLIDTSNTLLVESGRLELLETQDWFWIDNYNKTQILEEVKEIEDD